MIRKVFLVSLIILFCIIAYSQRNIINDSVNLQSNNGFALPTKGHIHILIVFAEIIYDIGTDPTPAEGSAEWKSGSLPTWKNMLLEPYATKNPRALISRYFYEASFGQFIVTGDFLINNLESNKPFQLLASKGVTAENILNEISSKNFFKTSNGFIVNDFDRWTLSKNGLPKITPSVDNPPKIDHLMIITRNTTSPANLSGWVAQASPGSLFGYKSDTFSFFCTNNILPLNIMLHEFVHLLMGGNNFHAGGGHTKMAGMSYFPSIQGGWSMMGAAGKSLLTWNAWDQRRLGWKHPNKKHQISTLDSLAQNEKFADLNYSNKMHQGIYLIRDFVSTGDAIRIKLPYIPENSFQQWLWIENHQTKRFNNSPFDVFQYEHEECIEDAIPGLFVYLQVEKEQLDGENLFGGYADYLRPLPANGIFDIYFENYQVQNPWCVNNNFYYPHKLRNRQQNPLSGNHEKETVLLDRNNDGKISLEEHFAPAVRKENSNYKFILPNLGRPENAYTLAKNRRIGIDTNPSSASHLTNVSAQRERYGANPPNNRKVFLNGISIEILEIEPPINGAMYVRISFDDYNIRNNVRWCADTIVLTQDKNNLIKTLNVFERKQLLIDASKTANRLLIVDSLHNQPIFNKTTVFILENNTSIHLHENSTLILDNESQLILSEGSQIIMDKNSRIIIRNNSKIDYYNKNQIVKHKTAKIINRN